MRVLVAGERNICCKLNAELALDVATKAVAAAANDVRSDKRQRVDKSATTAQDSFCPQQPSVQPFMALSWSPLAIVPSRGCLLLAAVADSCAVYARPADPLQLSLEPVTCLTPLLHAALGHGPRPSEAESSAVCVHSSSWSVSSAPLCREAESAEDAIWYLALGGPALLVVVAHIPAATPPKAQWKIAVHLQVPGSQSRGGRAHATTVRFAPSAAAAAGTAVGRSAPELQLFSGGGDGSIYAWHLARTRYGDDASQAAAPAAEAHLSHELQCLACLRVGAVGAHPMRCISSISVAIAPLATATSLAYHLVVGTGPFVQIYHIDARPLLSAAATATAALSGEGGAPSAASHVGLLVQQAAHAQDVTSVLCLGDSWYSASHDGSVLSGRLQPLSAPGDRSPRVAVPAATGGGSGDEAKVTAGATELFDYPAVDRLADGSARIVAAERATRRRFGLTEPPKHTASSVLRGDGEDELGRPENRGGQRAVFGLAAGPCSGGLALCLRSSYLDGHSTGRAVPRVEAWRLLLATVPLPLMSGQGATSSAADLMSAPKVPTDHWSTSPGRPLGASMWAVAASLLALPADQCASELERLESAAVSELRSTDETADGDSDGASQAREYALRGLQIVVALACECGSRPWTMRQMRAEDDDDGDAGSEEPSTSADGDEEAATELDAQLQRISKQISERCARLLLDVQAASLLAATASVQPPGAARHRRPSSSDAAPSLPAADWLLSSGTREPSSLTDARVAALRSCFQAAGCSVGGAALTALTKDRSPGALPRREPCVICERPVDVSREGTIHRCEAGHPLQRCWACLRVLSLSAWVCVSCGAGSCMAHDDQPVGGALCRVAPPGICGLCGTQCVKREL